MKNNNPTEGLRTATQTLFAGLEKLRKEGQRLKNRHREVTGAAVSAPEYADKLKNEIRALGEPAQSKILANWPSEEKPELHQKYLYDFGSAEGELRQIRALFFFATESLLCDRIDRLLAAYPTAAMSTADKERELRLLDAKILDNAKVQHDAYVQLAELGMDVNYPPDFPPGVLLNFDNGSYDQQAVKRLVDRFAALHAALRKLNDEIRTTSEEEQDQRLAIERGNTNRDTRAAEKARTGLQDLQKRKTELIAQRDVKQAGLEELNRLIGGCEKFLADQGVRIEIVR